MSEAKIQERTVFHERIGFSSLVFLSNVASKIAKRSQPVETKSLYVGEIENDLEQPSGMTPVNLDVATVEAIKELRLMEALNYSCISENDLWC